MTSEITSPVRRLDGPNGSTAPRTVKATNPRRADNPRPEHRVKERRTRPGKLWNGEHDFMINTDD